MNWTPLLACGPGAETFLVIFPVRGAMVFSLLAGIVCLGLGSKSLGVCLVAVPVSLFGLFHLWSSLQ